MPTDTHLVSNRIRNIRKSRHLRIKDCARVFGVSKETYRSFEEGRIPLSLPELELIAIYLGVSPSALLESNQDFSQFSKILHEDIRPRYLILRTKMIGAVISAARKDKAFSIDDLQQATQISSERLHAYEMGDMPILLSDLFLISDYLDIPHKALYAEDWVADSNNNYPLLKSQWHKEFSEEYTEPEDEVYFELLQAFKQISPSDQAQIAKLILEKLRN